MSDASKSTKHADFTSDAADSEKDIPTPESIGRYRVTGVIGKGGFGTVYRAMDDSLAREVAIKVPRRFTNDQAHKSQWNAEAKMVAMLDHPNIVPVYDVGSTDEFPFYVVSKFIAGIDLRERLQQCKPSIEQSITWVLDMAEALQHAHEKGLVHRDVKPSNILIQTNERSWLTDFGLAIRDDDIARQASRKLLVGTFSYMSPEQARGEGHLVDGRADIFALGIVLYEMLLGKRPFTGGSSQQLLQNIVRAEPQPLRQLDPKIDGELERICMKALAQRLSDRYNSGRDMADDLRRFANCDSTVDRSADFSFSLASASATFPSSDEVVVDTRVIPKGLRAFDEHDQNFFLKLVPGTRDANGVPEIIRRLKIRIEARNIEDSFRVGLIYGSSGSGKSSLVRAGLVPLLDDSIHVTYVEANSRHTESRMRSAVLPLLVDQQKDRSLVECMAAIRKGAVADGKKVVVFVDQFEQWLHAHPIMEDTELVNAIRQCDGIHLQCVVLIRDDFWMPATRFFHELDIRLVQDVNSTAVDRFELRHARYVLSEFGRAYGCLPNDSSEISTEQQQFIHTLVDSVQEDGKVISIHLVVLAQMLKGREWNLKTLAEFGGAEGIDINFLDATFNDSIASPHHRSMQEPARAVLAELLPEVGTNIKGQMKDVARLREVSGLNQREFEELLEALDGELRMITPTAVVDGDAEATSRSYQLTHDFLVPPLREWLTRSNRQTPQGRAKLRLGELTQYWRRKKESRFLPSNLEYLRILAFTSASNRTSDEASLMAAATRYYSSRWAIAAAIAMLIGWSGMLLNRNVHANLADQEMKLSVQRLLAADTDHVLDEISRLQPIRSQAESLLHSVIKDPNRSGNEVLSARLALVDSDLTQIQPLIDSLLTGEVDRIAVICERLRLHQDSVLEKLWNVVQSGSVDESHWLKAAFAVAQLDPNNDQWKELSERLARTIVNQSTPLVVELAPGFSNVAKYLSEPTQAYFGAPERDDVRLNAAIVLSKCLKPTDPELKDLLSAATPDQFELLLPVAAIASDSVVEALKRELTEVASPRWPDHRDLGAVTDTNVDAATLQSIEEYEGIATDAFVFCQRLPLDRFEDFADQLGTFGFRPGCVRAYRFEDADFFAGIWTRDELKWKFTRHDGHEDVPRAQEEMHEQGLFPADFTIIPSPDPNKIEYGILWTQAVESMIDSRIYVGLSEDEHQSKGWEPLNDGGYVPKSNLKVRYPDGTDRYSSVRWRTVTKPRCSDAWNDSVYSYESRQLEGWHQTDVRINPVGEFDEQEISFAAVWWNGGTMQSQSLNRVDHLKHLDQAKKLIEKDFRPVSISVVFDEITNKLVVASVWHRPIVSDDIKDELASRQANAVVALLRLGSSESLWPLLESRSDSRLQSYLINRMALLGVDPQILFHRLMIDANDSRRFAIIASLAQYRPEQLSSDLSNQLRDAIEKWSVDDPSAAIHSICKYLCLRWKWPDFQDEIENTRSPSVAASANIPSWFRNGEGQTMVSISGPVDFRMGSPGDEAYRDHHLEVSIKSRIPRSFAIGSTEVTVAQFQRYNPAALYATEYTANKDCPVTAVSWFDAINYCRWLSEQEGIPEDQMCYPPIDEMIAGLESSDGFELPKDFLKRTGYRLPTEAEWEYASRALTTTPRHYGNDSDLLSRYAWTTESSGKKSQVRFHPVGQLLPNGFGIFDTLGNVMEWCEASPPQNFNLPLVLDDYVNPSRSRSDLNILRGSAVFYVQSTMRSAKREMARTVSHHPYSGFRVARTMPAK